MQRKGTISYVLRNILFFLLPASIAAVPLALFSNGNNGIRFFVDFFLDMENFSLTHLSFSEVFGRFSIVAYNNILPWLLSFVCIIISFGIVICSAERHMRLGVRSAIKWMGMLNESFLLVLPFLLLNLVILELIALVASGAVVLLSLLLEGAGLFVASILLVAALYGIFLFFFTLFICTVPSMLSDGYSFRFAASYSAMLMQQRLKKTAFTLILMIALSVGGIYLSNVWLGKFSVPVAFGFYLFWVMYLPCFAMNIYISLTGGERKDLVKRYF